MVRLISNTVTIRDVAEAAGVSISLVSFVLNAKKGPNGEYLCSASKETAERIVDTAKRLGYKKNMAASSLRSGFSNTLGIVVADISNSFFGEVCRHIENISARADIFQYSVLPMTIPRRCANCSTDSLPPGWMG